MTLVPSHRLRLSGNSVVACFLAFTLFFSCGTPKVAKKPVEANPTPKEKDDKVRVYDPTTGTFVLVPKEEVKVDTVRWTEDKTPPIITDRAPTEIIPEKRSQYEISIFVPLNTPDYTSLEGSYLDPKLVRFLQYYGGMRIAADEVKEMGLPP